MNVLGGFFCNLKEKHLRRCLILSRVSFSPTVLCILMGALGIAARTGRIKTILEHSKSLRAATHGFFWPVLMLGKQIFRFPLEQNRSYFEGEKHHINSNNNNKKNTDLSRWNKQRNKLRMQLLKLSCTCAVIFPVLVCISNPVPWCIMEHITVPQYLQFSLDNWLTKKKKIYKPTSQT